MVAEPMPDPDIPYGVRARVTQLAREYPAVQYDASDPNASAIAACCHILGLEPVPCEDVPPRTIRGAQSTLAVPRDVAALGAALHTLICRVMPGAGLPVCEEDGNLAADLLAVLATRGWRLTSHPGGAYRGRG